MGVEEEISISYFYFEGYMAVLIILDRLPTLCWIMFQNIFRLA